MTLNTIDQYGHHFQIKVISSLLVHKEFLTNVHDIMSEEYFGNQAHKWIIKEKWPEPIFCDSGNGAHLLLPVDLPNNEESTVFVQNMLYGLHEKFSDDVIGVDTSVYNAARIMRVAGTMNCKGDNHPKYPHRMAKILSVPNKQESQND